MLRSLKMPLIAIVLASVAAQAQPASQNTVLPEPYKTESVSNPPRVIGWAPGERPTCPPGFEVKVFAENLASPRWLYVLPNGDVLVALASTGKPKGIPAELLAKLDPNSWRAGGNEILLLRDSDQDGVADLIKILRSDLHRPFGMALSKDGLYVAEMDQVKIYPFKIGQTTALGEGKKLFDLPAGGYNNHWTRNLLFDRSGQRLFVSVGSGTNVDENGADTNQPRAAILEAKPDGSDLHIYASGLRNPVGMALEPVTKTLFAVVNERDGLGDDLVPDYLTRVQAGGFYGWPYSYYGQHIDPRKKGMRPDLVAKAIVPDYIMGSHVAALGLCFYQGSMFPPSFHGGAFVGEHGSWNRSKRVGYKVVFVKFENGKPVGPTEDFLTGFSMGEDVGAVHGRPVGVAVAKDGALLVADDSAGKIWRVSYKGSK